MSSIIRRQHTTWTSVDNRVINDERLGLKALGLLVYMLSKPNDWEFRQDQLGETWGEGRDAMRSMMKTLQACGYVRREFAHDEQGRIRTVTIVSELPEQTDLFADAGTGDGSTEGRAARQSVQPPVVKPTVGQPAPIVKTDYDKRLRDKGLKGAVAPVSRPEGVSEQTWDDFVAQRKSQGVALTQTALNGIAKQAATAGWTLEDALSECCTRGWRGFKAEWVLGKQPAGGARAGQGAVVDVQARNGGSKRLLGFGEREDD